MPRQLILIIGLVCVAYSICGGCFSITKTTSRYFYMITWQQQFTRDLKSLIVLQEVYLHLSADLFQQL